MADIEEIERLLRPQEEGLAPYPAKYSVLASGEKLVVQQIGREQGAVALAAIEPLIKVKRDYYDLVSALLYAEILGWMRYRVKDEYVLIGCIGSEIVGVANGRVVDGRIGISYHTMAIRRGLRIGAQLFAAKMEYHFDYLKQAEVWLAAISPNGFRRWMIEYELQEHPGRKHELAGLPSYVMGLEQWGRHKAVKNNGRRPVPEQLLAAARTPTPPQTYAQLPGWRRPA